MARNDVARPIKIRRARPRDAEAIAAMAAALTRHEGGANCNVTAEGLQRDGFGPRRAFTALIAERGGVAVGYALYFHGYDTDDGGRGVFLCDLWVEPSARERGIGRSLVAAVARDCLNRGGGWVTWMALRGNLRARRFYRGLCAREIQGLVVYELTGEALLRLDTSHATTSRRKSLSR